MPFFGVNTFLHQHTASTLTIIQKVKVHLVSSTFFTVIDFREGFFQVLESEDRAYTAFESSGSGPASADLQITGISPTPSLVSVDDDCQSQNPYSVFHASTSSVSKTYEYRISTGQIYDPTKRRTVCPWV